MTTDDKRHDADLGSHPMPDDACPECRHLFEMATSADFNGARPKPGDASICIECTTILVFNTDMHVRRMTDDEYQALSHENRDELVKVQSMLRCARGLAGR